MVDSRERNPRKNHKISFWLHSFINPHPTGLDSSSCSCPGHDSLPTQPHSYGKVLYIATLLYISTTCAVGQGITLDFQVDATFVGYRSLEASSGD